MGSSTDTELLARAIRNPGRLVLGPTSTTTAFPYGGVSLGFHRDAEVVMSADYIRVRDPSSGRIVEIGRNGVEFPEIYLLIDGVAWDTDVVYGAFARATRSYALAYPTPPETRAEGTMDAPVVPAWPSLLIAAEDPAHPSAYFRRPVPTLSLAKGIALSRELGAGLPMRFTPTPDRDWATTPDWQVARLENLTL